MSDFSDLPSVTNALIYPQISKGVPFIYPEIVEGVQNQFTNVLLIDRQVPDYQLFVDSVNSSTFPIVYSTSSSKTELLAVLQKMFTSISRIGIAFTSESENVKMFLDCNHLFKEEEETVPFSENVQFIIDIINEFSVTNIDYLACNTLNYTNWTNYYQLLNLNTGVIVGASSDETGNIKYGGDWTMESTGQDIELIYFTQSIEYYTYLLDLPSNMTWSQRGAWGMCINKAKTYLYAVTNSGVSPIYRIPLSSGGNGTLYATIGQNAGVNTYGHSIAIDDTRQNLYVACNNSSSVAKITMTTPPVVTTYITGLARNVQGVLVDNDAAYLYITVEYYWVRVNLATEVIENPWMSTPVGHVAYASTNMIMNATGLYIYAQCNSNKICRVNVLTKEVSNFITINYVGALILDTSNSYMYVTLGSPADAIYQINMVTKTYGLYMTMPVPYTNPIQIAFTPDTYYMYVNSSYANYISKIALPYPCFKEDTKILTDKGYVLIQDLRKGDFVKTLLHDYKPIDMIGNRDVYHLASKERIKDQLYKCSQMEYPEVFEPLIISGSHSILVDEFTCKEQREKTNKVLGDIFITDDKYRLPACADERTSVYEIPGYYTVYHMALENDDYYENYGIFANGLLVESCSKRYLKELSNMVLIA